MTKKTLKSSPHMRGLKTLLVVGSLGASLLGTRLLAANEAAVVALAPAVPTQVQVAPAAVPEQTTMMIVQVSPGRFMLVPADGAAGQSLQGVQPVQTMRPIARSRSSR